MKLDRQQTLLRVYLRNTSRQGWFSAPAVETLVKRARRGGLAGATVLCGFVGLDVNGDLLERRTWSLVEHLPVIVEFVDEPHIIGPFLAVVEEVVRDGLVTLAPGQVLAYRHPHRTTPGEVKPLVLPGAVASHTSLPALEEFPIMKSCEEGQLLRVFIGDSDRWHGEPLYRAIVLKARELGLAGATVLKGPMGFGANSLIHTTKLLSLSTDLPVVIEIVDTTEKLQTLLPFLDEMVLEGMITIEAVRVVRYRHNENKVRSARPSIS